MVRNAWRRISQGPERLRFRRRTVAPENGSRSEPVGRPQDQWQEQEYEDDRGQETRRVRQLVDLSRPVGEEVGNAQLGRNVDRLRDPMAPNEGEKSLSRFVHEA